MLLPRANSPAVQNTKRRAMVQVFNHRFRRGEWCSLACVAVLGLGCVTVQFVVCEIRVKTC